MKKLLLGIAILFQLGILVFMAAEREWILHFGKRVRLQTQPVDPWDYFRGEYVQLNYDISLIPTKLFESPLPKEIRKDTPVYVILEKNIENDLWHAKSCLFERPKNDQSIFLKGKVFSSYNFESVQVLSVRYGIEKFFLEQGKGKIIEEKTGRWGDFFVPLEITVAVSPRGIGVPVSYQFCPIGVKLEEIDSPSRRRWGLSSSSDSLQGGGIRKSSKIKLTFKNCSERKWALVLLPDYGSFTIENSWKNSIPFISKISPQHPKDEDVILLHPQETFEVVFDFSEPRWHLQDKNGNTKELGELTFPEGNQLRIIYRAPSFDQCARLTNANLIWYGEIASRRFFPGGGID